MTNAPDTNTDRYLTIPELVERWPIGRTKIYELARAPGFPEALVLVRDRNGRPRSMGFLLSEIVAYEQRFRVRASDLDLGADQEESEEPEPDSLPEVPEVPASLPAAKKNMPRRRVA